MATGTQKGGGMMKQRSTLEGRKIKARSRGIQEKGKFTKGERKYRYKYKIF